MGFQFQDLKLTSPGVEARSKKRDHPWNLFEGGLLNFYVQCRMDGIAESLINRYLDDLLSTLGGTKFGTVLLWAETSVIRRRLLSRPEPSRNDRNPLRWLQYKKGLREAFNNGVAAGELMELDTGTLSVGETAEAITGFLGQAVRK